MQQINEILNDNEKLDFEYGFQTKVNNVYDSKIAEWVWR